MTLNSIVTFLFASLIILSCKNGSNQKMETARDQSSLGKDTSSQAAFSPKGIEMFEYTVSNFEAIKAIYKPKGANENDLSFLTIARGLEDSNKVYIIIRANDILKRMDDPTQIATKDAMAKAAVDGAPMVRYINIIRSEDLKSNYKEKVRVEYRVKDFDAWVKAYDEKGKDVRAAHGLIDRIIGRDLKDSNIVYLFFDVSYVEKAKARLASKELNQFMIEAGVITPPAAHFYRVVD